MSPFLVIAISIGYIALLFGIAYWGDRQSRRGRHLANNPLVYALSLTVYCTAWTFYGSVGRAASSGLDFLPVYLGPTLTAPLWILVLRKMILISKHQRITSVADFISARYGKSTTIGAIATLGAVAGVLPYISIQLKALTSSFSILLGAAGAESASALPIAIALALFAILFGTRHLDPNERHEGLVVAIAFESVLKLLAFLSVGIFVCFFLFEGPGDLFRQALVRPDISRLLDWNATGINGWDWFWLNAISMMAIFLLPRQFHMAVVENTSPMHVRQASWLFPLYLLLINLFVLPIAFAGLLMPGTSGADPDMYVLSLPIASGQNGLALLAALGGFSAAASMVIVSVIALSIMVSNNLALPVLVRFGLAEGRQLIWLRRLAIAAIVLLAYVYFITIGKGYALVSIGLVSFAGMAQFAPAVFGGMYWKKATKQGALAGLSIGFAIWAYTLVLPNLAEVGILSRDILEKGPLGIDWLNPYALFGLEGLSHLSHGVFWSLLLNAGAYVYVSLRTRHSPLEAAQADLFVHIFKYNRGSGRRDLRQRQARMGDLLHLMNRFLGPVRTASLLDQFAREGRGRINGPQPLADEIAGPELITFAETQLAGSIGSASAKIIIESIAREDAISLEEMIRVLEQTQEILAYNQALEDANARLKELDRMKADFITTVTHELRTPITSIRSLAKILKDNPALEATRQAEFLGIISAESDRIARLINQVLDIEKLRAEKSYLQSERLDFRVLAEQCCQSMQPWMAEKSIRYTCDLGAGPIWVNGDRDKLIQVFVNLLSNAAKFAPPTGGQVEVALHVRAGAAHLSVQDNGIGISPENLPLLFQQFTQIHHPEQGKPAGSGLGLYITRQIVEAHGGKVWAESLPGQGARFVVEIPVVDEES